MSGKNYAANVINGVITLFGEGKVVTLQETHPFYDEVYKCLKKGDYKKALKKACLKGAIKDYTKDLDVEVVGNTVMYKGKPLHNALTKRIIKMMKESWNTLPMLRFLNNLMQNPSYQSREELFLFLEGNDLPITEDGHFIAYKGVTPDYLDYHTRSFDQRVGVVHEMDRSLVDDNRKHTCSSGFHFASLEYASNFGARVMVLKINPRDVVSIPWDYSNQKGRCCRFEIIDELSKDISGVYQEYTEKAVAVTSKKDTRFNYLNQPRDSKGHFVSKKSD